MKSKFEKKYNFTKICNNNNNNNNNKCYKYNNIWYFIENFNGIRKNNANTIFIILLSILILSRFIL
jgi:hypothetical protein